MKQREPYGHTPEAIAKLRELRETLASQLPQPCLCPECGVELYAWRGARTLKWMLMHPSVFACPIQAATWGYSETEEELRAQWHAGTLSVRMASATTVAAVSAAIYFGAASIARDREVTREKRVKRKNLTEGSQSVMVESGGQVIEVFPPAKARPLKSDHERWRESAQ